MRQRLFGLVAKGALVAAFLATLCSAAVHAAAQNMHALFLEVIVNDAPRGLIAEFRQKPDGGLMSAAAELREIGILPPSAAVDSAGLVDLDRVPGLEYTYDLAAQVIRFGASRNLQAPHIYDAALLRGTTAPTPGEAVPGAVLNYLVHASTDVSAFSDILSDLNGGHSAAVALDGRVFGPYGVFSQSAIAGTSSDSTLGSVRLDSTWSLSDPQTLMTYRAGDFVSGGLAWTRPVRLGGVQVQRSFSLRPDLVTMPMPNLSGSAAVPSTVDVYVNNMKTFSQNVAAGPFEVRNLPIFSGAGTQRIVISDALGREVVTNRPFYASSKLLRQGLFDFSAEAGYRRFNFGINSDDYDEDLVGSGSLRHGVYDWLTLEAHAEAGGGLLNGGIGAVVPINGFGLFSTALGASTYQDGVGLLYAAAVELGYGNATFYARTERTIGDYMDIAALPGSFQLSHPWWAGTLLPPSALDQITLAVPLAFDPSILTFSYTHLRTADDDRYRILSAGFSRPIGENFSFSATAFTDLDDSNNSGVFFSLTRAIGDNISASANVSAGANNTTAGFDVIKTQPLEIGTHGWRVREYEGETPVRSAAVSYRAPAARLEAGVDNVGSAVRARGEVEGAVALAGGGVFFANRIDDAFAVVDTGTPGVDVHYENRPLGQTDGNGRLLVPYLRSYDRNQITIDPKNLPADADITRTKEIVTPPDRGATVVRFAVENKQSALVVFRNEVGEFVPTGSQGVLDGTGESFVIGYDGQSYISGLSGDNRVTI